jgi:hypothetical protein
MTNYIIHINSQTNGDHKVHKITCSILPNPPNRLYLGDFSNCYDAIKEAKKYDPEAESCPLCAPECQNKK